MNRRQFIATSGIGVTAVLAGCTGSASQTGETTHSGETETEITVSTDGSVEAEPDRATVSVGLDASGSTAEDVRDELASRSEPLTDALTDVGVPSENIEEGRFRITPTRDGDAFEGSRSFQLTIDDVDRVGEVVDAAIDAGADDIGRVNFGLQDDTREALRDDALDDALANADSEAAHIAANRGGERAGTIAVTTDDVSVGGLRYEADAVAESDDEPQTEFDADPIEVDASVTVTYGFEP